MAGQCITSSLPLRDALIHLANPTGIVNDLTSSEYSKNTNKNSSRSFLVMQVVLEEAGTRKVIFSTFDPDCATLLSLKQPRFPGKATFYMQYSHILHTATDSEQSLGTCEQLRFLLQPCFLH